MTIRRAGPEEPAAELVAFTVLIAQAGPSSGGDHFGTSFIGSHVTLLHPMMGTVDAAMVMPSRASSPWMRRYPQVGFS